MKTTKLVAFAIALPLSTAPAFARYDCDKGFKDHMAKMSVFIAKVVGFQVADAYRKSLNAYDSCKAGDDFSPHGVWDQIEADMAAKARK